MPFWVASSNNILCTYLTSSVSSLHIHRPTGPYVLSRLISHMPYQPNPLGVNIFYSVNKEVSHNIIIISLLRT